MTRRGVRSVVTRAYASSPLKFLMPRNHGHGAWVYTSNYGGGLLDGDAVRLSIDVAAGATAFLSTQASTKVYRSPRGTSMDVDVAIDDGGLLVAAPDPIVCFARARYLQTQRLALSGAASLVLVDWLTSGRRAAGERWAFDRYGGRLTVHHDDRLVLYDALLLSPGDGPLPARMGRFDVLCTLVLFGSRLGAHVGRTLSRAAETPMARRSNLLIAASAIGESGCIVRLAGVSVEDVGRAVRECLDFVPSLLGDDPWAHKW